MRNVMSNKICCIFNNYANSLGCFQRELRGFDKNKFFTFYEISTGKCYEKHGIFSISVLFEWAVTRKPTFLFFIKTENTLDRGHENTLFSWKNCFYKFFVFFLTILWKAHAVAFLKIEKTRFIRYFHDEFSKFQHFHHELNLNIFRGDRFFSSKCTFRPPQSV